MCLFHECTVLGRWLRWDPAGQCGKEGLGGLEATLAMDKEPWTPAPIEERSLGSCKGACGGNAGDTLVRQQLNSTLVHPEPPLSWSVEQAQ